MTYTLGTAARATGVSKSTIYRAIKAGRISASRTETGDYSIDPAELHRVFPPADSEDRPVNGGAKRGTVGDDELALRAARLEAEIAASALVAELLRRQLDETREDRDHWRGQAQRLVAPLPPPAPTPMAELALAHDRAGFMSRLFGRA